MTLDELTVKLRDRFGNDFEIMQTEYMIDGSSSAQLFVGNELKAIWSAKLISPPPLDGVTPRGEKDYYNLVFVDDSRDFDN